MSANNRLTHFSVGRPPIYREPVDIQVRLERSDLDRILEHYPGATISRAVALFISKNIDEVSDERQSAAP